MLAVVYTLGDGALHMHSNGLSTWCKSRANLEQLADFTLSILFGLGREMKELFITESKGYNVPDQDKA